jgi:hypothetical protein
MLHGKPQTRKTFRVRALDLHARSYDQNACQRSAAGSFRDPERSECTIKLLREIPFYPAHSTPVESPAYRRVNR